MNGGRLVSSVLVVLLAALLVVLGDPRPVLAQTALTNAVPKSLILRRAITGFVPPVAIASAGLELCYMFCMDAFNWAATQIGGKTEGPAEVTAGGGVIGLQWSSGTVGGNSGGKSGAVGAGSFWVLNASNNGQSLSVNRKTTCRNTDTNASRVDTVGHGTWSAGVSSGGVGGPHVWDMIQGFAACTGASELVVGMVVTVTGTYNGVQSVLRWGSDGADTAPGPFHATATCRNSAGATATAAETTAATANTLPAPDCEAVLPGSWRQDLTATQTQGDGTKQPILAKTLDLTAYPNCQSRAAPCSLGWSQPTATQTSECRWGAYLMPDTDCPPETKPTYTPTSPAPSASPSPGAPPPMYDPSAPDPYAPVNPETGGGTRLNPDGSETVTEVAPDGTTTTRTKLPNGETVTTTRPPGGPASTVRTPPFGAGVQGDDAEGCLASGFSWNPVSWVLTPVKCALQWAFVPSQSSSEQINALRAEAGARPPVSIGTWAAGAVPGFGDGFGAATSCTALPDFDPAQLGRARLPCKPDFALYDVGFALVQLFLVAVTGMYVWGMAQRALQASGGEVV
jgi:hypothetical protein